MSSNLYCASCGRSDAPAEGTKIILFLDIKWCAVCADFGETPSSTKFVNQPSPGRMYENTHDSLAAWQDCYTIKPKKRIKISNAKAEVKRAWVLWNEDKNGDHAKMVFYGWLNKNRLYFLTFRDNGDRWQTVHSWLIQYERRTNDGVVN